MVARKDLEEFRAANSELSRRAQETLEGFFRSLDLTRPELARDALLQFMPALTAQYGSVAATLAAEMYEEMRSQSGATGSFRASLAPSVPAVQVEGKVRSLADALWTPTPGSLLGSLLLSADKYVKQPGRDTTALNARREGARWARVPTGAKTCSWCLILASRDAVYLTKKSAAKGKDGEHYHGACDCQAIRLASADDYPPGYLPDNYYDMYQISRDSAGSGDIKDIAAAMRREFPGHVTDGVHTH